MNQKNKSIFWMDSKRVCYESIVIKTVSIPVAFLHAQMLAMVVSQATSGNVEGVVRYAFILIILVVLYALFQLAANIDLRKKAAHAVHCSKIHFLESFLENTPDQLFRTDYGELIENITRDMDQVTGRYIELYPGIVSGTMEAVGYVLFLFIQSPAVAATLAVISLTQLLPPMIVKKYMQISYEKCEEIEAEITNHVVEAVEGFETIKLYDLKAWWQQKLSDYHRKYVLIGRKADAAAAAQRSMYRLMDHILQFGTYALIGFYVIAGYCSTDLAVQAVYLSKGFFRSVQGIFAALPQMAVSENAEKRIRKWICQDEKQKSPVSHYKIKGIRMERVSCRCGDKEILNRTCYQFEPDKNYLLIGNNGAGKTTLLNLLAGLILPDDGEICMKGKTAFSETNPDILFYILQHDPRYHYDADALFQMFGKEKQEKSVRIAERFGLTEEIRSGKAICDLSGGERKKVFLSIGFAMEPVWLLLDEPSNNLDKKGRETLFELIRERKGTVLVSHDPLFRDSADRMIRIENGQIYDEEKELQD